jgi:hypothetical protein
MPIHNNQGNTETHYIAGEFDFRIIRLEAPWFSKTNLCLRYPEVTTTRPATLSIDYDVPLTTKYLLIPDTLGAISWGGMDLRGRDMTRIVLFQAQYNSVSGYSDFKLLERKEVPITKNYAMK